MQRCPLNDVLLQQALWPLPLSVQAGREQAAVCRLQLPVLSRTRSRGGQAAGTANSPLTALFNLQALPPAPAACQHTQPQWIPPGARGR